MNKNIFSDWYCENLMAILVILMSKHKYLEKTHEKFT